MDISISIMTYSGFEHEHVPVFAAGRVCRLLESLASNTFVNNLDVSVCDEESNNHEGLAAVKSIAEHFGVRHFVNSPWGGVSSNYNQGVRVAKSRKWVILLSDDILVTRNWLIPMMKFVEANEDVIGQAGWPIIFAYRLIDKGVLGDKASFYGDSLVQRPPRFLYLFNEDRMEDRPFLRGNCHGPAFIIDKNLWEEMGGFPEDNFQPDEFYGWWVWTHTDRVCVMVPVPPVLHYGGASCWGTHSVEPESPVNTYDSSWFRLTGRRFEERGAELKQIVTERADVLSRLRGNPWLDWM